MISMEFDTGFFIDLLQYILNTNEIDSKEVGQAFIDIFNNEKNEYPGINTPVNKTCINIIKDVINDELDVNDDAQLAGVELKIKESRAAQKDPTKFASLSKILSGKQVNPKKLVYLEKKICDKLKWYNSFKAIKKQLVSSQKFITSTDEAKRSLALMDIEKGANEVLRALEKDIKKSPFLEYINFNDPTHITRALELNKQRKHESTFKTGLQGLNGVLGDVGGLTCGDLCLVIALSGHHKTGTLMNMARWICTLNNPWTNRSGIPSVAFFSLENDINSNTEKWYYDTYCNMFGGFPENKTISQMVKMVHEEFNKKGFVLHVFREPANGFSIKDYKNRINGLIEKGYDIQATIFDYLTLMSPEKTNMTSNSAQDIVNMTKEMRDFGKRCGFVTIVGAQAAEMNWTMTVGKGVHQVKRASAGVIGEAKAIYQIADVVVYQYIEKNHKNIPHLTMFCGKYRDFNPTSEYKPFTAYKFTKFGIMDDIYGDNNSLDDIYKENIDDEEIEDMIDIF